MNDIVSIRNETTNNDQLDDVTIEKVDISKEELALSLFEYEQHFKKAHHSMEKKITAPGAKPKTQENLKFTNCQC